MLAPIPVAAAASRPPGPDVAFPAGAATPASRGLALSLRGLRRSFGDKAVLRGIDLDVPAGQFVAVVGRSGCGKSTLLRLLVGLDQPDGGRLHFGDAPAASPGAGGGGAAAPGDVRVMFQEPRLLPWASVLSNVEVGLGEARGRAGSRERAAVALAAVGLDERGAEWPSVLSGGQKQRVALARALVSRPRMLALDEPLGALDALTRISMQRLLERIWLEQGFTAVLVTHDVSEALALADRVLLIEAGRIALDLPVEVPRPRRRGSPELAALEERVLAELFRGSPPGEDA